jgi:hypothetical protein
MTNDKQISVTLPILDWNALIECARFGTLISDIADNMTPDEAVQDLAEITKDHCHKAIKRINAVCIDDILDRASND